MSVVERLIAELGPWSWWILGLLLLGLEILAPGTIFLWFGISALAVGALALMVDLSWQANLILFLTLSFVSLFIGRRLMLRMSSKGEETNLNKRGNRYIGRVFMLDEPIQQGAGRLSIDDTIWRINGPDLPSGTKVEVMSVEGVRLTVKEATP